MGDKAKPKWLEAFEEVRREIEAGKFPPGSAFYSLKQLCVRFNFSIITARRVFDELKQRGLLRTNGRQGAVVTGGLEPQTVYLALRPDELDAEKNSVLPSRFMYAVMEGFRRSPFDALFHVAPVALDFCLSHADSFRNSPMIVLQDALFEIDRNRFRVNKLLAQRVLDTFKPVVFQTCLSLAGFDEVGVDMGRAMREMVLLLAGLGHRRIAFFSGDVSALWFRSRFRGYLDGLEEAELSFDPHLLAITGDRPADEAAIESLLRRPDPPTAVVCANDTRALNILAWCRAHGVEVPEQLSVTGFGDFPEAGLSQPALTTHDPRDADMGAAALDLLRQRREGTVRNPTRMMIRPRLIPRASHASAPGSRISSVAKNSNRKAIACTV